MVTLPILAGLGGRLLFTTIASPDAPAQTTDLVVQGLFQGVLLQYVTAEHPLFAPALGLAFLGRSILDFSYTNYTDVHKLATTLISAVVGFAGSYLMIILYEEFVGTGPEMPQTPTHRTSRRKGRESVRESRRELTRARLREINARRHSRSPERNSPREYPISSPGTERHGPTRAVTEVTLTSSTLTMEQMGYTGLGRLLDLKLANLRKKAATAELDRRRCKEERKWAIAQGNKAHAEALSWQIKRYAAMGESYTREADRCIIEGILIEDDQSFVLINPSATRSAHSGQLAAAVPTDYATQYEGADTNYEHTNGHGMDETTPHDDDATKDIYTEYPNGLTRKE